ncbi:MAG: hypothetical protein ETSY2_16370 [Candidatus Entotheonella gemina]|uniref:Uncharacterized protein n=1 Tax=Candidatus Entotheonella gemina TaxID=1429439 RepID=W4M9F5_9BACT|nr:MAG: hypothetical protein ETSY2_16370 [Candidatus Entotheonella gemina]
MEVVTTEDVGSVMLFTVKVSETEMQAYESCIFYLLKHLSDAEIEKVTGHTREELEPVHDDVLSAIQQHCDRQYLPKRYGQQI